MNIYIYMHIYSMYTLHIYISQCIYCICLQCICIIEESLEVKLPTRWTDEKAKVGRAREEKRRERVRRKKMQVQEDSSFEGLWFTLSHPGGLPPASFPLFSKENVTVSRRDSEQSKSNAWWASKILVEEVRSRCSHKHVRFPIFFSGTAGL